MIDKSFFSVKYDSIPYPETDQKSAPGILKSAHKAIDQRAKDRDVAAERSMRRAVDIFNAISDNELSEADGWTFMIALKLARSVQGKINMDDHVDMAGYAALLGECVLGGEHGSE